MEDIKLVEVDNIKMNYFKFGKGKKNLIIIPGVSVKSVMEFKDGIINQYNIFSNEFSIYVFERRNNIYDGYTIEDMAIDLIKVLDYLKLSDLYIISVSQGGMISSIMALKRPDLIKKLVITSSTDHVDDNALKIFDEWIDFAANYKKEELALSFLKYVYTKSFAEKFKDIAIQQGMTYTKEELDKFKIITKALVGYDLSNNISNLKNDTLIICGKEDLIFDYKDSINLNKKIKNSEIYIYDNYAHALYDEASNYNDIVYKFFLK